MDITWLGHACFRLRGRDVTILTDPYEGDDWGYAPSQRWPMWLPCQQSSAPRGTGGIEGRQRAAWAR
jgi:L-ascorbate metabolism protein UlaG (beta-lactamase superfamily)